MTDKISYEDWKAQAIKYAFETYTLPDDCIEDDWFKPVYEKGATPQEAVDEHCDDYDIDKTNGPWGLG